MARPKVFIGSSSEWLGLAEKTEMWLDEAGCEPVLWTGVFEPGDYTAERLLIQARACDGAIMIFGTDDKTWFREEHLDSPRDNVVFELGLFAGAAKNNALRRVIFFRVGDSKVASDLKGLGYVPIDPSNPSRPRVREEVIRFAERLKEIERAYDPQLFNVTGKRELFQAGSQIIANRADHVTLAAKTPVPLMGARPYDRTSAPYDYETEQYNLYWRIVESAGRGESEFTLIASIPSIAEDLKDCNNDDFHAHVDANLRRLYDLASSAGSKVHLWWHEGLCPPAFLVADSAALVWWKAGNGDSIWMAHRSPKAAGALSSSRPGVYAKLSYDEAASRIRQAVLANA